MAKDKAPPADKTPKPADPAEAVIEGWFLADGPSGQVHVKADEQAEAVSLACALMRCTPQEVVVSKTKRKAAPKYGDLVLKRAPKPGDPDMPGFEYGTYKPAG